MGDEGLGVVALSLTGQTLGTMAFDWAGTGSSASVGNVGTEGISVDSRPAGLPSPINSIYLET